MEPQQYSDLIARESRHWGEVRFDPQNPQIWNDPELFEIFFGREYRTLVQRALSCGPAILELGCGEGNLAMELAAGGAKVTALDLSPQRIGTARARAGQRTGLHVDFQVADLNNAVLPPAQFDCVVAHDSLHHILELGRLCEEVRKALRPGGHFLVMDYVGMGLPRKLVAGLLYALLPTYQPYSMKWGLRRRWRSFLASEKKKRDNLLRSSTEGLHHDSPFEEISQRSIVREIRRRFEIVEETGFAPFWYYLAPKVRFPSGVKYPAARLLHRLDALILRLHLARGAYIWIDARNR